MRNVSALLLAGILLPLAARPARAKDLVEASLAKAKEYAKAKDVPNAAKSFGQAVASAQAGHSLEAEQTAADALDEWASAIERDADPTPGKNTEVPPDLAVALSGVMKALDPARSGAFVPAHARATETLVD